MAPRPPKKVKAKEQLPPQNVESDGNESASGSDISASASSAKRSRTKLSSKNSKTSGPRVWTNEEEIILLKGMNDYKNRQQGLDPLSKSAVLELKGKFEYDFSVEQIRAKIRCLRRRFCHARNRCKVGADPVYSKPHDCLVFQLSKNIWADYVPVTANAKKHTLSNHQTTIILDEGNADPSSFRSKYPYLADSLDDGLFPRMLIDSLGLIVREEDAREWDQECKKLHMEEMELKEKMKALVRNHSKVDAELGSFQSKYRYLSKMLGDVSRNYPSLGMSHGVLIDYWSSVEGDEEAREWDERCKKLHMNEMELKEEMRTLVRNHSNSKVL